MVSSIEPVKKEDVAKTVIEAVEQKAPQKVGQKEAASKSDAAFIYVGPAIKGLSPYSIFKGGLPSHLQKDFEACPALKSLFVSPEVLNETLMKLADAGTAEAIVYEQVKKYFSEVKA